MNASEGENGDRIKYYNQPEENHRFSTLKQTEYLHNKSGDTAFYDVLTVFYSVMPKSQSSFALIIPPHHHFFKKPLTF